MYCGLKQINLTNCYMLFSLHVWKNVCLDEMLHYFYQQIERDPKTANLDSLNVVLSGSE